MDEHILGINNMITIPYFFQTVEMSPFSKSYCNIGLNSRLSEISNQGMKNSSTKRGSICKVNVFPDCWPVMAVLSILKIHIIFVDTACIMFTCLGCCFFGAMKDPYYDSEYCRGDDGDGTEHWVYEKQEEIEESSRATLWHEDPIEEVEQKADGLRKFIMLNVLF
ncbi:hypothetical protein MKX01_016837 [Papaver californicum]|nr:hypothetical protein MKX01_016837 [Papaver californicum]